MKNYGAMKGYSVTEETGEQPYYTQLVNDEFAKITETSLFFESFMDDETATIAKDNSQALCLGSMTSQEFFESIAVQNQEYIDTQGK